MTPTDVQALFLDQLGVSLGDEMIDYIARRFVEGGAASVPVAFARSGSASVDPIRRFAELAGLLGDGAAVPAEVPEPTVH